MLFFFKQKTAYEMRISDWSSDVCSSDLDQHIHPGISAPGHGVARQAGGCSPDTAPRLDPTDAAPFKLGNDPVRHLVIEVGARLCGRFPSFSARATVDLLAHGYPPAPPQNPHGLPRRGGRSEAHTSELQSLMRLSHHVF